MKVKRYYETLGWGRYWRFFLRGDQERFLEALRADFETRDLFLTRSGRTSIILSLAAFGLRRDEEVLVPRYMSTCVLDAVNQVALPSLTLTDRTKAVLLYHHWGFQQDYAKAKAVADQHQLRVIEDCAHGLWGRSQGISLGTFGDTAIFSLSKIYPMTYAGALRINDPALREKIIGRLAGKPSWHDILESIYGEIAYVSYYDSPLSERGRERYQTGLLKWYASLLVYARLATVRGDIPYTLDEQRQIFQRQNRNFLKLLRHGHHPDFMAPGDEEAAMAPMCYPVLSGDELFLKKVEGWLKARDIHTGIYHFDVRRNMFAPEYRKCVPVPLYSSLSEKLFDDFVKDFRGTY